MQSESSAAKIQITIINFFSTKGNLKYLVYNFHLGYYLHDTMPF